MLAAEESNAALSFRNLARVAVLTHENVGVADLLGAASLLISQTGARRAHARAPASDSAKAAEAAEEAKA